MNQENRMKQIMIAVAVMLLGPAEGLAQTSFAYETPSLNRKVRNLGMGNVGVALRGTGDSSPFYNPAGLNDLEKGRFQFLTNTVDMSQNATKLITDVKGLVNDIGNASNDADRTRVLNDFIQKNSGRFQHFRYTLDLINYARKNFAVGLMLDERMDLSFRDQSYPHFDIQNLGDAAMYIGGSHDFWNKGLQVGVMLRPTMRFSLDEADQQVTFADVVGKDVNGDPLIKGQFKKIYKEKRFGLGIDVGLKSNLGFASWKEDSTYKYLAPEVGVTWQDIGSPTFDTAPGNRQSFSAGTAIHPDFWKMKNTVALDFRELNRERAFLSKVHFGVETQFPWILALRAGMSQGYISGGLTLDFWVVKIDGAIYYEEIGAKTHEKGNLRWAGTLSFNI